MGDRVKIGIIGVGQIGKRHIAAYQKLPVELVAFADVDEAEANRVAAENGGPKVLTDFRKLLEIEEIEAVDVCLHNNFHAPVTIAALEAGKHVYCEKPIAGSYADGKTMVEAAHRTGRLLSIQLGSLFSVETKAAQRLLQEGYLGTPYYAKSIGFRRRGRPDVDGYGTSSFVQKSIAAGGAMFDMGVYHIAQMLHLLGNPALASVTGATHQEIPMYADRQENGRYDVEELGVGLARLAGGVTFFIEESWALHLAEPGVGSRLVGSRGGIQLSPFAYHSTVADMEMDATFDLKSADWRWHQCVADTDAYDSPQAHWVAALQGRVPLIDTAGIALSTMLISEGIYLSAQLQREVTPAEIEEQSQSTAVTV
ncbi:MAG: Gfo/Idh/MocA family oxidoreductase [Armatimonadota bacterium]|nr:MAG: Gfo/Idh/MocA family oxidoreductase [Armatimonadota bacterium]